MFIGILVPIPLLGHVPSETIILIWIMSFLPDLDILLEPFQKIRNSYFLSHKAGSHSIIVGFIFTFIISAFCSLVIPNFQFILAWLGGLIGYSIHTFLDSLQLLKYLYFIQFLRKNTDFLPIEP